MLKRLFWILAVTAVSGAASAQQDFLHRPSPFAGRTLLTLSVFDEVRAELKTTSEVNGKEDDLIAKVQTEDGQAFQDANGDFKAITDAIEKINAKYDDELLKLLTADQVTRLKGLFIQFNDNSSVTQPVIAKDLALTDEQTRKIKKLVDEQQSQMMDAFQSGPDEMPKAMKKMRDDFVAAVDKLLTDDQKKKMKDMQGDKFTFKKDGASR